MHLSQPRPFSLPLLFLALPQHMRFGALPRVAEDLSSLVLQAVCSFNGVQRELWEEDSTDSSASCSQSAHAPGKARAGHAGAPQGSEEGSGMSQFRGAGMDGGSRRGSGAREDSSSGPFPRALLARRPLFNQMIANWYAPSEGIRAHVDLLRFDDGIAILSLLSPCVMSFARASHPGPCPYTSCTTAGNAPLSSEKTAAQGTPTQSTSQAPGQQAAELNAAREATDSQVPSLCRAGEHEGQALLQPGDLLLLWGEARYMWSHAILRDGQHQYWAGGRIPCKERISITLRKLVPEVD